MNSSERKYNRYIRRKKNREKSIKELKSITLDELFSIHNLMIYGKKCCNGVRWKESTIKFENNIIKTAVNTHNYIIKNKRNYSLGFNRFKINECGKIRDIHAIHIYERMVHKCLCYEYLIPLLSRSFISTNFASQKNKGIKFSIDTLKRQLINHKNKYQDNGGILLIDIKHYFASLSHEHIKEKLKKVIENEDIYNFCVSIIDGFKECDEFSAGYGIGLGSEFSQLIGLLYLNDLDHYILQKYGSKISGYGRYMDDGYIICNNISLLNKIKDDISHFLEKEELKLHEKKTVIIPFHNNSFHFLKFRFRINENNNRLTVKINRKLIFSVKRNFKQYKDALNHNKCTFDSVYSMYSAYRSAIKKYGNNKTLIRFEIEFIKSFQLQITLYHKKIKTKLKCELVDNHYLYYYKNKCINDYANNFLL